MRLKFDDHILDVVRRELWCGSARVAVEPQVFDLLAYLVQNPDRVVSRDELLQAIWDGRAISDSAIANRINGARRAIGDSGEMQRVIRTVPRKGFRLIGPVEELPAASAGRSPRTNFRRRTWQLAGSALLGAAIAVILVRLETFSGHQLSFQPQAAASPAVLVSALLPRPLGAGANDPGLAAIALDGHVFNLPSLLRPGKRASPVVAKPNRDIAVAGLPANPIVPVAMGQEQKAPLAKVAVAASTPIEPPAPSAPSFDKRVDEAKWSVIPCTNARIDLGAGAKCQVGPPASWGGHYCDISQQVATVTNARYQIEAEVRILDPYKVTATGAQGKGCAVWADQPDKADHFKDMNQMTQRGGGWANLVTGATQSTATFTNGGRNCLAIKRLGPPWHGGSVWVVNASICPTAVAGSVRVADIDDALATLQVRTYDAQANLRAESR